MDQNRVDRLQFDWRILLKMKRHSVESMNYEQQLMENGGTLRADLPLVHRNNPLKDEALFLLNEDEQNHDDDLLQSQHRKDVHPIDHHNHSTWMNIELKRFHLNEGIFLRIDPTEETKNNEERKQRTNLHRAKSKQRKCLNERPLFLSDREERKREIDRIDCSYWSNFFSVSLWCCRIDWNEKQTKEKVLDEEMSLSFREVNRVDIDEMI